MCGAGTPISDSARDRVEDGPCRHVYRLVEELGEQTAVVWAVWHVTSTAGTGEFARRPDIGSEAVILTEMTEIQAVGAGG